MDDFIRTPGNQEVRVGDTITYRAWGGALRTGRVEEVSSDIKNGRPGFSMATCWGYADQIERVA
jgi:hypothetical protein